LAETLALMPFFSRETFFDVLELLGLAVAEHRRNDIFERFCSRFSNRHRNNRLGTELWTVDPDLKPSSRSDERDQLLEVAVNYHFMAAKAKLAVLQRDCIDEDDLESVSVHVLALAGMSREWTRGMPRRDRNAWTEQLDSLDSRLAYWKEMYDEASRPVGESGEEGLLKQSVSVFKQAANFVLSEVVDLDAESVKGLFQPSSSNAYFRKNREMGDTVLPALAQVGSYDPELFAAVVQEAGLSIPDGETDTLCHAFASESGTLRYLHPMKQGLLKPCYEIFPFDIPGSSMETPASKLRGMGARLRRIDSRYMAMLEESGLASARVPESVEARQDELGALMLSAVGSYLNSPALDLHLAVPRRTVVRALAFVQRALSMPGVTARLKGEGRFEHVMDLLADGYARHRETLQSSRAFLSANNLPQFLDEEFGFSETYLQAER
jgi:hypothetical protein